MDKTEYQLKLDELNSCVDSRDYQKALAIVEEIDWRRVKSIRTLSMVADIYEVNKDYRGCKEILLLAYDRSSIGKGILYRLADVSLKLGEIDEALDFFDEYKEIAGKDSSRYVLEYKIARARRAPLEEQIKILEAYKDIEYTERWAYELALLYHKAGNERKCVNACDDMVLWFSEGKYVLKALELKQNYQKLLPSQQKIFDAEKKKNPEAEEPVILKAETPKRDYTEMEVTPEKSDGRSIFSKLDAAGARAAEKVEVPDLVGRETISEEQMDKYPVTSKEFMGATVNLKAQLQKSIDRVFSRKKADEVKTEADLPEEMRDLETTLVDIEREEPKKEEEEIEGQMSIEDFDLDALLKETASDLSEEITGVDAAEVAAEEVVTEEVVTEEVAAEEVAAEEVAAEEVAAETVVEAVAAAAAAEVVVEAAAEEAASVKPKYNEELEIPDPEPSPKERITRTISLNKIGQNTVPVSLEDVLRQETPEERRIRILNNAKPSRMSDEQRKIYTYFARIPGMDKQILEAISNVYRHAGEHTSKSGNIAVMGARGTGKSRLSQGLIFNMCQDLELEAAKMARIDGAAMNSRNPAEIVAKMSGGFLIVENASLMMEETITKLNQAMQFRTDCMILIIEDEKTKMRALLKEYPDFAQKFNTVISIPVFTNDELVTFARTYAAENGCKMDELGVLALYTMIGNNQTEAEPVTIQKVKEMMDDAIHHALKGTKRRGRRAPKDKWTIIQEKDFELL